MRQLRASHDASRAGKSWRRPFKRHAPVQRALRNLIPQAPLVMHARAHRMARARATTGCKMPRLRPTSSPRANGGNNGAGRRPAPTGRRHNGGGCARPRRGPMPVGPGV